MNITNNNEEDKDLEWDFKEAVAGINTLSEQKHRFIGILTRNKSRFDDRPGRIPGYEHELRVTDDKPFFQKGWPIPLAYQRQVDEEINRML